MGPQVNPKPPQTHEEQRPSTVLQRDSTQNRNARISIAGDLTVEIGFCTLTYRSIYHLNSFSSIYLPTYIYIYMYIYVYNCISYYNYIRACNEDCKYSCFFRQLLSLDLLIWGTSLKEASANDAQPETSTTKRCRGVRGLWFRI